MLSKKEKDLAKIIQGDIPLQKRPFQYLEGQLAMNEEEVITIIKKLQRDGIIRKFGAILRHQRVGITKNAMVVWAVPEEICENVGTILSTRKEITHCYERVPFFEGKYNLFTMIHLKGGTIHDYIQKLSSMIGVRDYKILESEKEFKKNSMEYFK